MWASMKGVHKLTTTTADIKARPVKIEKRVKQSNELPTKCRPSTWNRWMKEPKTTPCEKAATAEP
jgi:hypothetical protein